MSAVIRRFAMTEALLNIKRWGNSLGVRLPVAISNEAHLHLDQQVRIEVENGHVIITPIADTPLLTLGQRLDRFDPVRHGGEMMVTENIGAEKW
jgi:antitoxin MazE